MLFYENGRCATAAIRKYSTLNKTQKKENAPTVAAVMSLVKKFKETGSVHDERRSGRPSLSAEKVNKIKKKILTKTMAR